MVPARAQPQYHYRTLSPTGRPAGTAASRDHTTTQNAPSRRTVELRWWLPASFRVSRSLNNEHDTIDTVYAPYNLYLLRFRVVTHLVHNHITTWR